ncbi:class I tRNA ligase family protein, partial [Patescibacteria group bacterium]|nr:class I tRNA ligase family protein [Patescibacteria group bacterium]
KKIIEKDEYQIIPETRKNEILSFINQGLEDISFSRSVEKLKWGIPVPGDETQVMYVWADALSNYLSALGGENSKYWPADIHCIGKDILKFHALIWPAMLLSLKIPLPKRLFVHGFITVDGQKMSKSIGNVIDPFELVDKYGADAVRYYLLRELSSSGDGDFTYDKFEERYNADLASGVGNLLARVKTMAEKVSFKPGLIKDIEPEIKKTQEGYKKALEDFKFNEALKSIWDLIGFCDRYIDKEKPWEHKDNSPRVIDNLLIALDNISELLEPFLPETAEKIKKEIKRKSNKFSNPKSKNLFPRLTS